MLKMMNVARLVVLTSGKSTDRKAFHPNLCPPLAKEWNASKRKLADAKENTSSSRKRRCDGKMSQGAEPLEAHEQGRMKSRRMLRPNRQQIQASNKPVFEALASASGRRIQGIPARILLTWQAKHYSPTVTLFHGFSTLPTKKGWAVDNRGVSLLRQQAVKASPDRPPPSGGLLVGFPFPCPPLAPARVTQGPGV